MQFLGASWDVPPNVCIVLEYVPNGTLHSLLHERGLDENRATQPWLEPTWQHPLLKIAIGVAYTAAIVVYAGTLGRRAARAGLSADLEDHEAGYAIVATDR